jgi:hypothetical protein
LLLIWDNGADQKHSELSPNHIQLRRSERE